MHGYTHIYVFYMYIHRSVYMYVHKYVHVYRYVYNTICFKSIINYYIQDILQYDKLYMLIRI